MFSFVRNLIEFLRRFDEINAAFIAEEGHILHDHFIQDNSNGSSLHQQDKVPLDASLLTTL